MTDHDDILENGSTLSLGRTLCNDAQQTALREWWLSDGLGGYAGGSVGGILTRRYHGLLIAPLYPPLGRFLLVAKADAELLDGDRQTPLHSNRWGGDVVSPQGHRYIESFRIEDGMPVWRYALDDLRIEQRIWMTHGAHRTQVAYRWLSGDRETPPTLRLSLLANVRDHHGVSRPQGFSLPQQPLADGVSLRVSEDQVVEVRASHGAFSPDNTWIENFFLALEHERGLEDSDTHLRVGFMELPLIRDQWVGIGMGLGHFEMPDLAASLTAQRERVSQLQADALPGCDSASAPGWIHHLVSAADSYVFRRAQPDAPPSQASVIAGFPWFGDWGRDTMIALPGLTLATGRPELAREILDTFADYVSDGMLPNVFPGSGETPEYNTVDAALWYIEAWRAYYTETHDLAALRAVFPTLREIIHAYRDGTRYGIGMDPADGLIHAGEAGQQLTWMDARVEGREITPRQGKPVEINALWYNALRAMAVLAHALGQPAKPFTALAERAAQGFTRFSRGDGGGLYDVLDGPHGHEATIRPNQIFTLSLTYSPLSSSILDEAVLHECRTHLLTPFGLRSLSPQDSRYSGRYLGGVRERDGSYHQGPVWGWLLGHYALAHYRVNGDAEAAQRQLAGMARHLKDAGVGHISEIFDGDPPHQPRGAPAQAWSLACTLEAWWRLQRAKAPKHNG